MLYGVCAHTMRLAQPASSGSGCAAASSGVLGEDGEARPAGGATMIDPERMEVSRGANYFAFEGASGDDRWRNAGSSYRHDLEAMSQARPL